MEPDFSKSIVEKISFRGKEFFLKRDDLIHESYSGNKARKFFSYFAMDLSKWDTIVSYGGNQSNAMYSLSAFAKLKNKKFLYYTRPLPWYLKKNPVGNFRYALENNMEIVEIEEFSLIRVLDNEFFIKQGGAEKYAEQGVKMLADEIEHFAAKNKIEDLSIFLPSGTGATALYLQKHSKFRVYTTPCVGDSEYLRLQFSQLEKDELFYPTILEPEKKYAFGKPYKEFQEIWLAVTEETKKPFDLLYDPLGWLMLEKYKHTMGNNVMYIQCGGILGNETMLNRYNRKASQE